jgi:hypothetical protein
MRSSLAVGLLLTSSLSIFGLYGRQQSNAAIPPGPEPVFVNGQMGVYDPDTGQFVPSTSPLFDQICDKIQARRDAAMGVNPALPPNWYPGQSNWYYSSHGFYHSGFYGPWYYHGLSLYTPSHPWFGGSSASRSFSTYSGGSSASHFSSSRGGFGSTGHSFGGSHS